MSRQSADSAAESIAAFMEATDYSDEVKTFAMDLFHRLNETVSCYIADCKKGRVPKQDCLRSIKLAAAMLLKQHE